MKRNFTKGLLMSGLALAGIAGAGQVQANKALAAQNTVEYKATTKDRKSEKEKISVNDITGGLNFLHGNAYGMSPKEYGMRYGHGGTKRSNRLRYSHNAKLKRRISR